LSVDICAYFGWNIILISFSVTFEMLSKILIYLHTAGDPKYILIIRYALNSVIENKGLKYIDLVLNGRMCTYPLLIKSCDAERNSSKY